MKKAFFLIILTFCFADVYGQEKTDVQQQFENIYKNSHKAWIGKPYRTVITTFSGTDGRPETDYSSTSVLEVASDKNSRLTYENKFKSAINRSESLMIGDKVYKRDEAGIWKIEDYRQREKREIIPAAQGSKGEVQTEHFHIGTEKLGDHSAEVYLKKTLYKSFDPKKMLEKLTRAETKFWFAPDGSILKMEFSSVVQIGGDTYRSLVNQTWELDPEIKIEAPVVLEK